MAWVQLVALLALFEYMGFGTAVGNARTRYGIKAPAITGNETFERYFRVQQNTLELLVVFLPALAIAAVYWNPLWVAAIGAVYLVGRLVYFRAYVRDPGQRSLGYGLSIVPVILLAFGATTGAVRALLGM
jgi:glutathione S-transferase